MINNESNRYDSGTTFLHILGGDRLFRQRIIRRVKLILEYEKKVSKPNKNSPSTLASFKHWEVNESKSCLWLAH